MGSQGLKVFVTIRLMDIRNLDHTWSYLYVLNASNGTIWFSESRNQCFPSSRFHVSWDIFVSWMYVEAATSNIFGIRMVHAVPYEAISLPPQHLFRFCFGVYTWAPFGFPLVLDCQHQNMASVEIPRWPPRHGLVRWENHPTWGIFQPCRFRV